MGETSPPDPLSINGEGIKFHAGIISCDMIEITYNDLL
jgi:hypothetical protein